MVHPILLAVPLCLLYPMYYQSHPFLVVEDAMALPLESNLGNADEAEDGGLAAMEKMLADSARKASEKEEIKWHRQGKTIPKEVQVP